MSATRYARRLALLAVVLVLAGIVPVSATTANPGTPPWSPAPALASRVREEIANRWGVAPEMVRLEWGARRSGAVPAEDAAFELIGTGTGGNWIVAFNPRSTTKPALRVWLRAGVLVEQPVAARDLERDRVLAPADIAMAEVVQWGGAEAVTSAVGEGWVTRRQVRAGEPLREPAVAPPLAVRSGELVQAVWRRPGVELTVQARALGSAGVGERVMVRAESGRRLEGTALGMGLVEIDAPPEVRP
jgi:flagella basal body P-ring formation protein FlgA